jgi:hypothetical protein
MRVSPRRWTSAVIPAICLIALDACGGSPAQPSLPGITLSMPDSITAQYVTCGSCETEVTAVAEFEITVSDPNGPGGTLQSVQTVATDTTRSAQVARNTRPNRDVTYPATTVPRGGGLSVPAGIVMSPAPPPRDAISLTVSARLSDGRSTSRTVPVVFAEATADR